MTAGITTFAQISARVNDLIDDSLAVARMANYLTPTVTQLSAMGMMDRKVNEYNAVTFVAAGEDDDTSAHQFTKDALATLTPSSYRARIDITDQRAETDFDAEIANAALEFGSASAKHIDSNIASAFSSATGGTIGSAGTVLTWTHITAAHSILIDKGIPAGSPVYCALHPYQWWRLVNASTIAGATVSVAPQFQDRMTAAPNYFQVPAFQGITFVISNSISIDASDDAYGAIYVPQAFAVDMRKQFNIRPERDESRELTELNASMWYASGVWRSDFAVVILSDAATPSV